MEDPVFGEWWNIVFKELKTIDSPFWQESQIKIKTEEDALASSRFEQEKRKYLSGVVDVWNEKFQKIRFKDGKFFLLTLQPYYLLSEGFLLESFSPSEFADLVERLLEQQHEADKIARRRQNLVFLLAFLLVNVLWIIIAGFIY